MPRGVNFSLIVLLKFEFVQFDYASQKWGRIFFFSMVVFWEGVEK